MLFAWSNILVTDEDISKRAIELISVNWCYWLSILLTRKSNLPPKVELKKIRTTSEGSFGIFWRSPDNNLLTCCSSIFTWRRIWFIMTNYTSQDLWSAIKECCNEYKERKGINKWYAAFKYKWNYQGINNANGRKKSYICACLPITWQLSQCCFQPIKKVNNFIHYYRTDLVCIK